MVNDNLNVLKNSKNAKKIFSSVFRKAKKTIVIEDEDDFLEDLSEYLITEYGFTQEDSEHYTQKIYDIWEDCGCSLTAFDRQMGRYKKEIF